MTKVELISRTEGVGIFDSLSQGEMVEAVARHGKIKDYGKLIKFLIKHKHWSPLEHVHFSFRIETARDISAQMIRHRSFHWQELSQRYDEISEFMPVKLRKQGKTNRQVGEGEFNPVVTVNYEVVEGLGFETSELAEDTVLHVISVAQNAYNALIEAGVARECARRILPMCAKTVVTMTGNLRDFLGYLNVRCQADTQEEHREVAMGIGYALQKEMPEIFNDLEWETGNFM